MAKGIDNALISQNTAGGSQILQQCTINRAS
jgi:hypothetical protein